MIKCKCNHVHDLLNAEKSEVISGAPHIEGREFHVVEVAPERSQWGSVAEDTAKFILHRAEGRRSRTCRRARYARKVGGQAELEPAELVRLFFTLTLMILLLENVVKFASLVLILLHLPCMLITSQRREGICFGFPFLRKCFCMPTFALGSGAWRRHSVGRAGGGGSGGHVDLVVTTKTGFR